MKPLITTAYLSLCIVLYASVTWAAHGLSIDGQLKYSEGFTRFSYADPQAQKGGELVLHAIGSFDKMNPFTLKGTAPDSLELLVFEPLMEASQDEPFAQYGLLAHDISIGPERQSVTFTINKNARFSDGSPVTPDDVVFTMETLKSEQVHPLYPYYYADIEKAEIVGPDRVRFVFAKQNRELALIAGQISILSKKFYETHSFVGNDLVAPLGSGPYVVESFSQGKSIVYKQNENYWARNHPVRRHLFNFKRIVIKYYKDQTVAVEAFKAGEFDIMLVNIAKQWARDMTGPKFDSGTIIKKKFPHKNNAGMQGFVMNMRKPLFQDLAVRQALNLAFDFDWVNKTLFFDQYDRSYSFFSNSELAAQGPLSQAELELLEPYKDSLPQELFDRPMHMIGADGPSDIRSRLRQALQLLKAQGWELVDGVMQNGRGVRLEFEILLVSPSFERVMAAYADNLEKIGIRARYRTIDPALYTDRINRFDFDMCVFVFAQSLSPGNEQRNFWHSEAADKAGSRNLAGIKNPIVDYLVDRVIYAKTRSELITACRALDRVLWHSYYIVPNWYMSGHRIAYHNTFKFPDEMPYYYDFKRFLMSWWKKQ